MNTSVLFDFSLGLCTYTNTYAEPFYYYNYNDYKEVVGCVEVEKRQEGSDRY